MSAALLPVNRWSDAGRHRVTSRLVTKVSEMTWEDRVDIGWSNSSNPFHSLLKNTQWCINVLPHLVLDYPLPSCRESCALVLLLESQCFSNSHHHTTEQMQLWTSSLVWNVETYGFDCSMVEESVNGELGRQVRAERVKAMSDCPAYSQSIFHNIWLLPPSLGAALLKLPTFTPAILDQYGLLGRTASWPVKENRELFTAILVGKGCDPNLVFLPDPRDFPFLPKQDEEGYWPVGLSTVSSLDVLQPDVVLKWLLALGTVQRSPQSNSNVGSLTYPLLNSLNLHQHKYANFKVTRTAMEVMLEYAETSPFDSRIQTSCAVLCKLREWQQRHSHTGNTQHEGASASSSSSTSSSSASTLPPVVFPSRPSLPHLSATYMQQRLDSRFNMAARMTEDSFDIVQWLKNVLFHLDEFLCTTNLQFQPNLLSLYPEHLYLVDRLHFTSSGFYTYITTASSPANQGVADWSQLAPYTDLLIRQLERLSNVELLDVQPQFCWLQRVQVPVSRGDVIWQLWNVYLAKHRQAQLVDTKFSLDAPVRWSTSTMCPEGSIHDARLFFLFRRLSSPRSSGVNDDATGAVLLVQLLRDHGYLYDNCGNSFSWHCVNLPSHPHFYREQEISIADELRVLEYVTAHGLLELTHVSPITQRTLMEDAEINYQTAVNLPVAERPQEDCARAYDLWLQLLQRILDIVKGAVSTQGSSACSSS